MNNLVSVIVPVYNASLYIKETINSVINQTHRNWELIIVNDGSTDNSKEIIELFKNKDHRIIVLNKMNTGVSDTRNKGLEIAKGDFITFLDADDIWHTDNLEKKVKFLLSTDFDLVYSYCQIINEKNMPTGEILTGEYTPTLKDFLSFKGNYNTAPSGWLYRQHLFEHSFRFDVQLSNNADQDILIQVISKGYKIGLINESLWSYRIHDNNMSKNIAVLEKDMLYLLKKCSVMKLYRSFFFKQKCISNVYMILAGSWWKDGNSKIRGGFFLIKSFLIYPPVIFKLIQKPFR